MGLGIEEKKRENEAERKGTEEITEWLECLAVQPFGIIDSSQAILAFRAVS